MPFGMGPFGWFLVPYFAQWWAQVWRSMPWAPYPPFFPWSAVRPPTSPQDELAALREQARALERELEAVRKRIEELEKEVGGEG